MRVSAAGAVIACALGALIGGIYLASVWASAPSLARVHPLLLGTPSEVFAANGTRLGFIQSAALRTPVGWNQIPADVKNATVAIEDQRFYQNDGIDLTSIARAAVADVTHGETLQGASTITMQLVRNLFLGGDLRTLKQKLAEAKLAIEYNKRHSKREILNEYLNDIAYGTVGGQTTIGVQAASLVLFNKPVWQLDLQQAALLAGLPQAPTSYDPLYHPALARWRRNQVLTKMAQLHYISRGQEVAAQAAGLETDRGYYYQRRLEGFFFEYVRQELVERYGASTVDDGGLRVYTTLDLGKQRAARTAISQVLPSSGDPAAAIVSIDPRNGYIRAMAESPRYEGSQFNLAADAHRQAGSTFKTFVLLTALRQGVSPYSTYYPSKPLSFVDPKWGPINIQAYSGKLGASYSIATALMQSNDPIFTLLDLDLGPPNVKHTAELAGITPSLLTGLPSEALGGLKIGVTPLEMADAYATVASGGYRNRPIAITRVVFPDGRVEDLGTPQRTKVFSDGITAEATKLLEQYITAGLGTAASYGCPYSGGKTGTADNNTDAWFVGFTSHLSSAVWIGYPQARIPMTDVEGVTVQGPNLPAMLWHDYMQVATSGECLPFPPATEPVTFKPFFGQYESAGPSEGESSSSQHTQHAHRGAGRHGHHAETPTPESAEGGGEQEPNGGGGGGEPEPAESSPGAAEGPSAHGGGARAPGEGAPRGGH
ncbi:MAG: penicillin-binding protein [Acidobacteriota bacterium]|nr:penicillin-binding protein [Acidobacteriota bacterium]